MISSKESKRSIFYKPQQQPDPSSSSALGGDSSDLVSNTDRVVAGTPFSILRQKQKTY